MNWLLATAWNEFRPENGNTLGGNWTSRYGIQKPLDLARIQEIERSQGRNNMKSALLHTLSTTYVEYPKLWASTTSAELRIIYRWCQFPTGEALRVCLIFFLEGSNKLYFIWQYIQSCYLRCALSCIIYRNKLFTYHFTSFVSPHPSRMHPHLSESRRKCPRRHSVLIVTIKIVHFSREASGLVVWWSLAEVKGIQFLARLQFF